MTEIKLLPLEASDREQFILDNQEAFNYGALEEFGRRNGHFEEDEQIISRETIAQSIDEGEAYRIWSGDEKVGGVIVKIDGERGDLELLFVKPNVHSKGVGYAAWRAVERLHPEVAVWETVTPYFEKRNILSTGSLRQVLFFRAAADHLHKSHFTHLLYELKCAGLFDFQQGLDFFIRDLAVLRDIVEHLLHLRGHRRSLLRRGGGHCVHIG